LSNFEATNWSKRGIVPGGQIENRETYERALVRELNEEFQIRVAEGDLERLGTYDSPAVHHPGKTVRITLFLVRKWEDEIKISSEIEGIVWVNSTEVKKLQISPFTAKIAIPLLLKMDLVD